MNKKGQITQLSNITLFFLILGGMLALGLIFGVGGAVIKIVGDNVLPQFKEVGSGIEDFGDGVNTAITPVEKGVSFIPFLTGVLFLLMIVGSLGLAFAFRVTGEKYLMIIFFALTIALIMASIMASNVYEEFYNSSNQIGTELKEQALLSFLMLYSPIIFTIIAFLGAGIMFSGMEEVVT